ncbi:KilA-N domain [Achromobacter sp. 2789STDY5608633]|jgi:hypothetical protein|uniref:KilA-N domain-containing protein n=1 Tax=Achromobacter insuavis TaxID=1287735 RepID=A0A6J4ZHM7_9BURK|nr:MULTISPECIES: KilA-N domain-containing protein [Achromobacter]CAB3627501.1 hypothetical protein LMG26845_00440 [Achromobacter insuavis]CUJ78659.1 KilA-N domain [Achromobacter sp. 2789STDY5608633]
MPNALIIEQYEGLPVQFMGDGWFNATGPAKRHGKKPAHWLALPGTKSYMAALGKALGFEVGFPDIKLIRTSKVRGQAGTWLHPKLAVPFARWLSDDFAVWCDLKIDAIARGGSAQPDPNALSTVADREPLYLLAIQIMVKHGLSLPVIYRALAHFAGVESFKAMLLGHIAQAGGFGGAILAGTDSGAQWRQLESNRIAITGHPSQSKLDLGPLVLGSYRAREAAHA